MVFLIRRHYNIENEGCLLFLSLYSYINVENEVVCADKMLDNLLKEATDQLYAYRVIPLMKGASRFDYKRSKA